jgi:hypothetical protein
MARATRSLVMSAVLVLGVSSAQAQPAEKKSMSPDDATRLGAARGVISPRLADCAAHCAKQLGDVTGTMSDDARNAFTQSCREACENQMAGSKRPEGPAQQRSRKAAADFRSLYMMAMLMEQSVFCIRKLGDKSAEARALVNAVNAAKKTPEALAADDLERQAGELRQELGRSEEGLRVKAAHEELARVNESKGPRSAAADAAREAVSRARAAAEATPLGKRAVEAVLRAQYAREKANQTAAATEATRAWEAHTAAFRARAEAAPKAEQERMQRAMRECIDAFGKEQMRGPPKQ